eukprot:scaffold95232_cov37-Tisochrysis_lutea.AAC.2
MLGAPGGETRTWSTWNAGELFSIPTVVEKRRSRRCVLACVELVSMRAMMMGKPVDHSPRSPH